MSNSTPPQLQPTFIGHISSTMDALILFEACLSGQRAHVPRRPHDRERDELIRSGHVFIYEENASGIKRWTDGYNWSPSRILGNFLIYRELEKAFPPGEKKRAMKRKKSDSGVNKPPQPGSRATSVVPPAAALDNSPNGRDLERSLIGSLVDSYPFKEGGLVKKTISVKWNGVPHHLVSYYSIEDVTNGNLTNPSKDPELSQIIPRSGLISTQDFRVPVDQEDYGYDERTGLLTYGMHGIPDYGAPGSALPRSMSLPTVNMDMNAYSATPHHFGMPPNYQPQLDVHASMANGHYMHPSPNGYSMDPRSRSTSMATIPYTPQSVTMMESPSRRQSAAYEIATSAGSDPNLASLTTIPETRHMPGINYYHGGSQFAHRPSFAMSAASGSDLFETSRELGADQLMSFDRTPQNLSLDEVDRNWFAGDFGQSHILGTPQASWPRGVSHT